MNNISPTIPSVPSPWGDQDSRLLLGPFRISTANSTSIRLAGNLQGLGIWQTDTPRYGIIGRNSPHLMHSMRPKMTKNVRAVKTAEVGLDDATALHSDIKETATYAYDNISMYVDDDDDNVDAEL